MSADQQRPSGPPAVVPLAPVADATGPRPQPAAEFIHLHLAEQARRAAGTLSALGVAEGERVGVLLPVIPESVATAMACGSLGALRVSLAVEDHATLLRRRIREHRPRVVVTADFCHLADRGFPTKATLDRALVGCPSVRSVLVVHRTGRPVPWVPGRDHWWHEALGEAVRLGTLDT